MKKFIAGLIIGALIMTAGSAWAAEIVSLVGKTIQGQFPVTVDGEKIEMPAIVVDGTSFLPVRKFAETVGYAVYFDPEGEILLEQITNPETKAQQAAESQARYDAIMANQDKEKLLTQIESAKKMIASHQETLNKAKQGYLDAGGDPDIWEQSKMHEATTQLIAEQQAIIDQLTTELNK